MKIGKKLRKINLGERQTKIVVVLFTDDSPADGSAGEAAKRFLLETLLATPALGFYNGKPYERLKMFHDGEKWLVELEMVLTNERELGQ